MFLTHDMRRSNISRPHDMYPPFGIAKQIGRVQHLISDTLAILHPLSCMSDLVGQKLQFFKLYTNYYLKLSDKLEDICHESILSSATKNVSKYANSIESFHFVQRNVEKIGAHFHIIEIKNICCRCYIRYNINNINECS